MYNKLTFACSWRSLVLEDRHMRSPHAGELK
jgi:hypothetical protein